MRIQAKVWFFAMANIAALSCTDEAQSPSNLWIEPAVVPSMMETNVIIRGEHISPLITVDHQDPNATKVQSAVRVMIGDFDTLDAHLKAKNEIHATVPAGMSPGTYDLTVIDALGREGKTLAAFVIRPAVCEDVPGYPVDCGVCQRIPGCECGRGRCSADPPLPVPSTSTTTTDGPGEDPVGHKSLCGDGFPEGLESCDDGALLAGDGCSDTCTIEQGWVCAGTPSVCMTTCGDGYAAGPEQCDDGAFSTGDGCDGTCQIELGWACLGHPSVCTPDCGDGDLGGSETCDDGDLMGGDGCSQACAIERGWICPLEGMPCITVCGDGLRAGEEICDNGNLVGGDGCDGSCQIEPGWECGSNGEICNPICGDSQLLGGETCDDGNDAPGDGCSDICQEELGWECGPTGLSCRAICGDGFVRDTEACDDANLTNNDGCTGTCTIEQGYSCPDEGQACIAICGDSLIRGLESCDDGDATANDGCSGTCELEDGWICPTPGQPCQAVCGDGYARATETCDDGNRTNNDGCNSNCAVESGFTCPPQGGACTPTCGDLLIRGAETCDDGNTSASDGCDPSCRAELGWICPTPGPSCIPLCADGRIVGSEQCDDGNGDIGDGCTDTCTIEQGFACPMPGQPCSAICGDSEVHGTENCDDGNGVALDGCSNNCRIEGGWSCPTLGSPCQTICGDGTRLGLEACDDDNTTGGDGCTATCTREPGFNCPFPGFPCQPICGDSMMLGSETCDDGNTVALDGCSTVCAIELGWGCPTPGSGCETICGDRRLVGLEACEDGNNFSGDGCNSTCSTIEPGWTCPNAQGGGPACVAVCGDGVIRGRETCDDGNAVGNDGCSAFCRVESLYECSAGNPSVCARTCGNSRRDENESCDDGARVAGDGCSASCQAEAGFVCARFPSICTASANVAIVDDSATCPGSGTAASPYCSITGGLATSANTLYVRPGEYRENVTLTNRTLNIVAEDGAMLIATTDLSPALRVHTSGTVTVTGLAISGGLARVSAESATINLVASQVGPGTTGAGVLSSGTGRVTLDQTRVVGNYGGGMDLAGSGGFTIESSVINTNGSNTAGQGFGGIRVGSSPAGSRMINVTVADNVAASTGTGGVRCDVGSSMSNMIVWGNRASSTNSGVSPMCTITYSDVSPSAAGNGNISVDPQFVRPTYHIPSSSPAVNTGDPATAANADYDGRAIPTAVRADMGAYENTPSSPFVNGRPTDVQALDERIPKGRYLGIYNRGRYPFGNFVIPSAHKTEGLARGNSVVGRTTSGAIDASTGRVIFLVTGGSDVAEAVCTDSDQLPPRTAGSVPACRAGTWLGDALFPPREAIDRANLTIVNGAYPNQFAENWSQADDPFPPVPFNAGQPAVNGNWDRIRDRVLPYYALNALSEAQVQAMYINLANESPVVSMPDRHADAAQLMVRLGIIIRAAKQRYPNLQQVFLSSRPYSGFATNRAPGEPYAYETGFAVKWLIEAQIAQMAAGGTVIDTRAGDLNYSNGTAPWINWGGYIWNHSAGSQTAGARWSEGDFENTSANGFFSDRGDAKASLLYNYNFATNAFMRCWYMLYGTCE
jgi:cysteine-rich repeat protein